MENDLLMKILKTCGDDCNLESIKKEIPERKFNAAIDILVKYDHLEEVYERPADKAPRYALTAVGKIALREGNTKFI